MNGTVIQNFLAVFKQQKILGNICVFVQIFYRKQSSGAPACVPWSLLMHPKSIIMLSGRGMGRRQGMGWGFDIFQNFAVKFPAHGHIILGKCPKVFAVNGSIMSNFRCTFDVIDSIHHFHINRRAPSSPSNFA